MFSCFYLLDSLAPLVQIELLENNRALLLYPNPTSQFHTLELDGFQGKAVQIDLYDIQGRKIKEIYRGNLAETDLSIQVDVSDLASGVYMYAILLNDERKSIRFVKE